MREETNNKRQLPSNYWELSQCIACLNPDKKLESWEAGFSSTQRKNISRINKAYDVLSELDTGNLAQGEYFFSNLRMSILEFMKANGYQLTRKANGNASFKKVTQ
jgi:hypothetical protein